MAIDHGHIVDLAASATGWWCDFPFNALSRFFLFSFLPQFPRWFVLPPPPRDAILRVRRNRCNHSIVNIHFQPQEVETNDFFLESKFPTMCKTMTATKIHSKITLHQPNYMDSVVLLKLFVEWFRRFSTIYSQSMIYDCVCVCVWWLMPLRQWRCAKILSVHCVLSLSA